MQAQKPFITSEECDDLAKLMGRKYSSFLKQRFFAAEIKKDSQGVYAKVTLRNQNGSFFYPVEGRMAHIDHDMDERAAGMFLFDYIDAYFAEFFREDGGVYLPIDWADYDCEGIALQLKGQILNLEVERMADELLSGSRA